MKSIINKILILIVLINLPSFAKEIKITPEEAIESAPVIQNVICNFSQNKFMKSSNINLKSGGDFKFEKENGVIFETKYPIINREEYSSNKNKRIAAIVKSVSNRHYTQLDKKFDILSEGINQIKLRSKEDSPLKEELNYIKFFFNSNTINKMVIDTKNTTTTINFTNCRAIN